MDDEGIDLRLCRDGAANDPVATGPWMEVLCTAERERMARFRFDGLRHQYGLAHGLVRQALSRVRPGVAPRDWRFVEGANGKPAVAPSLPRVAFNLSHTRGLIALAVSRGLAQAPLGVDVEDAGRDIELSVAERFFAPEEVAALRALPAGEQRRRFFTLWSLKESFIKATGLGMSLPLAGFSFAFSGNGRIVFRRHRDRLPEALRQMAGVGRALSADGRDFCFRQATIAGPDGDRHALALCAEGTAAGEMPPVRLFETAPSAMSVIADRAVAIAWDWRTEAR